MTGPDLTRAQAGEQAAELHQDVVCRIVRSELEAAVVFRTDALIGFLDHHPVFKGHVLVCPVVHVDDLLDCPDTLTGPLLAAARAVTRAQQRALGAEGSFSAINTVVSQSVPHLHLHVVPRVRKDGLRGFFWPRTRYAEGEAADYARRLREALDLSA
ncbi:histidine triad (HIT) family protein [Friedmanniella endophytica]|uniref:Histidine triad (HIT) family protein n=1 Tax=Microlunatus kandeliicorticis TaxID=1759536 RepID=A0A7W3ITC7_9ACTN|nr:HIT family protein [Microlunatus kandeliicorticis]MBA8794869.1 histidine triad (HIT) family protein [Microlunatus kandeliicorticis]